ncbi:MAG: hypothetical protein H7Z38_04465 [Rubrivivax sp.]|nr:hypothetical protein [Pyrinomonadaceae bacterium]
MWAQLFDFVFSARDGGAAEGRHTDNTRWLARFAVLGAFVFGVLPASVTGLAQAQKAGASGGAGVKKTAKTGGAKAESPKADSAKTESAKVDIGPIRAFIARTKTLNDQGKLDLSKPQTITVDGDRQADGTLTNVEITGESAASPEFRRVADDFVASVNQSHALKFLEDVSRMRMVFTLDGERFKAETASTTPTPERADSMARGYRMMLNFGRMAKRGTTDAALMSGMKISSSGKQLLMNFDMPREQMGNILLKQITPN